MDNYPIDADVCGACGGWCCKHEIYSLMNPRLKASNQHKWDYLNVRCVEWVDDPRKINRYFILHSECPHTDDSVGCKIFDERPHICRNFPKPGHHAVWQLKCELYKKLYVREGDEHGDIR